MFPRNQRVHRTSDILRVFRQGERFRVGSITLFYLKPNSLTPTAQATVIVDKKLSKKAVVRNKIKRQLRAALRKENLKPGMYVLRGFSGSEVLSFTEIERAISTALSRVTR